MTNFNIYLKPYVVVLIYDRETLMYILSVFFYENDTFTLLSQNSYKSHNFAILSCFKRIIDTRVPIYDIASFHRHDTDQKTECTAYSLINSKVCGLFVDAYFHVSCNKMKAHLLKYLWIKNY